jgi:hypothetical protein
VRKAIICFVRLHKYTAGMIALSQRTICDFEDGVMDDFEQYRACSGHEVDEADEARTVSDSVLQKLLEELAKTDKKEEKDEKDKLLEGDAKKLASKLANGELSKEDEEKLRFAIKEAFTSGKTDNFVKYLNAELKALKSNFEFVVPKQDVLFTLKVNMINKTTGKEAWSRDVVVAEIPRIG